MQAEKLKCSGLKLGSFMSKLMSVKSFSSIISYADGYPTLED